LCICKRGEWVRQNHDMIGPEFETHDRAILNSYYGDPVRRMPRK